MVNNENKSAKTNFYKQHLSLNALEVLIDNSITIYISGTQDDNVLRITKTIKVNARLLSSNHEEPDTKLVSYAFYVVRMGAQKVAIYSPNTDVLVLLLLHFTDIASNQLCIHTGPEVVQTLLWIYISVHELQKLLFKD